MTSSDLPNRLRQIRSMERKTLSEFADQVGIHFQSYRNYEVGTRAAPAALLITLAELGYNPDWLLRGEGPMKRPDLGSLVAMCSEALDEVLAEQRLGLTNSKRARVLAAMVSRQLAAATEEVQAPDARYVTELIEIAA